MIIYDILYRGDLKGKFKDRKTLDLAAQPRFCFELIPEKLVRKLTGNLSANIVDDEVRIGFGCSLDEFIQLRELLQFSATNFEFCFYEILIVIIELLLAL